MMHFFSGGLVTVLVYRATMAAAKKLHLEAT